MAITVAQISALVGRYTNEIVNEQANLSSALIGKGIIKKKKIADKVGVVNIKAGELASTAWIPDAGTLPTGGDVQPVQGTYLPVGLFTRISIPRIAAKLASSGDDGIELVKEEMESAGQTLARQLGRGIIGQQIGSPTVTVNVTSSTFTVASPAAWRVGMAFEVYNGVAAIEGTSEATLLRVTNVAIPADGVGDSTITFTSASGTGNLVQWLTTYSFFLRGAGANRITSLSDVTANAALYGVAANTNEWSGNLDPNTLTFNVPALRALMTTVIRRRAERPSHVLSNRKNEERYSNTLINNRRFMSGKMDAVGGATFEFEGVPWVTDENFDDNDVYLFQDKDVLLHEFQDFYPEIDGAQKKGMNLGAALISDTSLIYDVQVLGIYNLRVLRRNGTARQSALNS